MRFATTLDDDDSPRLAAVRDGRFVSLPTGESWPASMRSLAGAGPRALDRIGAWLDEQPDDAFQALAGTRIAPALPDPGAVFTIGLNYDGDDAPPRPERPMVFGKLPSAVTGHGATVSWDRAVTDNVDAEAELGVVIGSPAFRVVASEAMRHVFGYTCINDMASRDAWLDGDQWLLGKSMPGFCPVGPVVVTPDELPDAANLRLGCTINGTAIQDGSTADMRFKVPELIAFLSRHVPLRPGDLIATGTPARLHGPLGPERRLTAGDVVTVWIEGVGELTNPIA
jgi:5-carboxymethyl-2-hydroxymuconate isomerase